MKNSLLAITAIAAGCSMASAVLAAGTQTQATVNVALTPKCVVVTPPTLTLHYEAFTPSGVQNSSPLTLKCTAGLSYRVSLDESSYSRQKNVSASSANAGLAYVLSIPELLTTGVSGTGANENWGVTAQVDANQAGSCVGGCAVTENHTIYITY